MGAAAIVSCLAIAAVSAAFSLLPPGRRYSLPRAMSAFLLSPAICPLPLLLIFGVPDSPLYIGFLWPDTQFNRTLTAALSVALVSLLSGYFMEFVLGVPLYFILRALNICTARWCLFGAAAIGAVTPIIVDHLQNFRQAALRAWVGSYWMMPIGATAGFVSGLLFVAICFRPRANKRAE